ncbi:uncharacterized protein LOC110889633 [Helianthus annuus]|uniref:uncharacterized protein LOC110889633 n=1 Tax=Helianthus annuus TaxID=4232 RepID=UPI000B8FC504|nr:uncharacterized protein LOC110889633 [Helianthus annuus]
MWDPTVFECNDIIKNQRFILVQGSVKHSGEILNIVNIYAYNDPIERRALWEELVILRRSLEGMWIFGGDFNDVREPSVRFNSEYVAANADRFNRFIVSIDLVEYQKSGRKFTYHSDNGIHKSKLDRLLVCREFRDKWATASVVALSDVVSDHCPILQSLTSPDFGPIPTRIFNSWLDLPGVMDFIRQSLSSFWFEGPADLGLAVKLKWIKFRIKERVNVIKAERMRLNGLMINGAWETAPPLIKDTVCSFFAEKCKEMVVKRPGLMCPNLNQISKEDAEILAAPFSLLEIKDAVWDCVGDKAPGPDGANFRFIKRCWGSLQADFVKGLRQGDPLSPFLFIIAVEAQTGVMKKACNLGLYEGIRFINHGTVLSHFLYADDVIFVGNWSIDTLKNLRRLLRCFFLASGLRVNLNKSSVIGVNGSNERIQDMALLWGCRVGSFPFKHLGLPVGANMNLSKHWQPVIDVFRKRLALWKANTLSFGGRLTLIKSVLSALPTYYFSLYRAPAKVIDQLERLWREFLWGITSEKGKMSWVAWKSVITPKELGGVGIGSLKDANLAMLAKWWWRFKIDPESLWRKVIWSIHHNERTWNLVPRKLSVAGPWKQVAKVSEELERYGINLITCFRAIPGNRISVVF